MKEKLFKKGFAKRLFSVVLALAMVLTLMPMNTLQVKAATKTVIIDMPDMRNTTGNSVTIDGVTFTATNIDREEREITGPGSFTTSSGTITKIEIDCSNCSVTGDGWASDGRYLTTWTGTASSNVSFDGNIRGSYSIEITIEETNSHAHDWEYSLEGTDKIKAHCKTDGHDGDDVSLTLSASSENYSGISGLSEFNTATGKTIAESNVEIYKVDAADTTTGGTKVTGTPSEDGYYYASLTVEGQTAVKAFTIGTPGGSGSGYTTLPTEINGYVVDWGDGGDWQLNSQTGAIECWMTSYRMCTSKIDASGVAHDIYDSKGNPISSINDLSCGKYHCDCDSSYFKVMLPSIACSDKTHETHYYAYNIADNGSTTAWAWTNGVFKGNTAGMVTTFENIMGSWEVGKWYYVSEVSGGRTGGECEAAQPICACSDETHDKHWFVFGIYEGYGGGVYYAQYTNEGVIELCNKISKDTFITDMGVEDPLPGKWYGTGGTECVAHTHTDHFGVATTTTANDTLTWYCGEDGCDLSATSENPVKLTLTASDVNYSGSTGSPVSFESTTAWTGAGLSLPDIKYVGRGDTTYTEKTDVPTTAGTYTAKITAGDETASVDFEIKNHNLTLATETMEDIVLDDPNLVFNKDTIAAVFAQNNITPQNGDYAVYRIPSEGMYSICQYDGSKWSAAGSGSLNDIKSMISGGYTFYVIGIVIEPHTHTDHYGVTTTTSTNDTLTWYCEDGDCPTGISSANPVSLTLSASSANYSGSAATITVGTETEQTAWTGAGLTVPTTISYEKADGTALTAAPTEVGSYVAKVSPVGETATAENTAKVSFTIEQAHGADTAKYGSDDTDHWNPCLRSDCTNAEHKYNKTAHSYDTHTHKCVCGKLDPTYHQHVLGTKHNAVGGNCVDKGTIEYYDCSGTIGGACGKYLDAQGNVLESIEGTVDATNHKGTATTWTKTATTHKETYNCCGAVKTAEAAHTGGTATCQAKAKCSVCQNEYGNLANHVYAKDFTTDKNATCTEKGSKSKHCTTAGCTEKTEVTDIDPLGHTGGTATCQKKAVCTRCEKEYGNLANHVYAKDFTTDKNATCTEKGSKSKHCTTAGCTEKTEVTDIDPLGHTGGTATCQKKAVCTRCEKEYGNLGAHVYAKEFTTDKNATCTEKGSKSKHCTTAGCTEKTEVTDIQAKGHNYTLTSKEWAADGSKCSFVFTCQNDSKHIETVNGTITKAVKTNATCTAKGTTTYTAKCTFNGKEYTDTKDITDISAKGHTYVSEVNAEVKGQLVSAATCTSPAVYKEYCKDCKALGTKTFESGKALGHNYTLTSKEWAADGSKCSFVFTCQNDSKHIETVNGTITKAVKINATCTAKGTTTYTAKCTFEGKEYTDTKDIADISAKGHSFVKEVNAEIKDQLVSEATCTKPAVYKEYCKECKALGTKTFEVGEPIGHNYVLTSKEWSADNSKCDFIFVCQNDDTHKETVSGTVTKSIRVPSTCTAKGIITYTAKCTFEGVEYTTTKSLGDIPMKEHTPVTHLGKDATCTETGLTDGVKCKICDAVIEEQEVIPAKGHTFVGPRCVICGALNPDYVQGTLTVKGIYELAANHNRFVAGLVVEASDRPNVEYSWWASKDGGAWIQIQDWTLGNEWINWKPAEGGDYVIVAKARYVGDESTEGTASTIYSYHPGIKGVCQIPFGEDGNILIGVEAYDDEDSAKYTYEVLILDCTLLAEGKDAWIYSTGRSKVQNNCLWTIWKPDYGYYWTLFRVYDENGKLVDQLCYGFNNI